MQRVDGDLYSAYAVAQDGVGGLPAADLAQLPDAGTFTALRNLLYALEWWVFGGVRRLHLVALRARRPRPEQARGRPGTCRCGPRRRKLFQAYRVLAPSSASCSAFCILVVALLKYLLTEGTSPAGVRRLDHVMWASPTGGSS